MIGRPEALELLEENVQNENLIKYPLAVEAIMRGLPGTSERTRTCGV